MNTNGHEYRAAGSSTTERTENTEKGSAQWFKPFIALRAFVSIRVHSWFQILFLLSAFTVAPAYADDIPVEISAAKSLEWDRAAHTYTARGDVVAKKGEAEIHSATMTAAYTEGKGGTEVDQLRAEGHVVVSSPPYKAYGDRAVYDTKNGDAVLTGKNLHVETGDERLSARDEIRYAAKASTLTAKGNAKAVKGPQTLSAETLTALFAKDAQGKMITKKITAAGNIVITTEKETVTGDSGVYNVPEQTAELTGHVRILQGKSFLEGTRATVDMATGVSRLFAEGDSETQGRVKGVFYSTKTDN
jgi:lipopolysaccharide export system protein LptA